MSWPTTRGPWAHCRCIVAGAALFDCPICMGTGELLGMPLPEPSAFVTRALDARVLVLPDLEEKIRALIAASYKSATPPGEEMLATAVPVTHLDGLKAIAAFIEELAHARGIAIRTVTTVDVWRWARRQNDRLPTYRRTRSAPATMADPVAVESWFLRRRFAIVVDGTISP